MKNFYSILIDKTLSTPIYQQIGDGLCDLIERGVLEANSKLPPIRQMAAALKINAVTVVAAYKYLENKKIVYSHVGKGTFVSPIPFSQIPEPVVQSNRKAMNPPPQMEHVINFVDTSLPDELFPVEDFKAAFDYLLSKEKGKAFSYLDSQGFYPLRESLSQYFATYGIQAGPDQIQILSGAQQGIDIAAKTMMSYGDVVFMERPSFYGAAGAFLSHGGKIIEIEMEPDGMKIDLLENLVKLYRPRFIYLMAYFQTPTGISYSLEKKRKILDMAETYDFYVIEDDNLYDFHYTDQPIVPLKALDYKNRVIYIKSFSKILMPGLRIGAVIFPKKMMDGVLQAKYTADIATSGFIQKAFDYYLRNGDWEGHVIKMRRYCKEKYQTAVKSMERYLSGLVKCRKPEGGISLWLELTDKICVDELLEEMLQRGVIAAPGSQFLTNTGQDNHIRVSFSNVSNDKIDVGFLRIRDSILSLQERIKEENRMNH